jgi:2-phospho-L-lactate guanylyltransferase
MRNYAIVVPVREFKETKRRLRGFLSERQRAILTDLLLTRVLNEAEKSRAVEVVVVASEGGPIRKKMKRFQKVRVIEESIHHGGVNKAMRDGIAVVAKRHPTASILLIPADLPLLSQQNLDRVSRLLEKFDLVINPSSRSDGTSLLAFNPDKSRITLHYDDDSFRKHVQEATKLKLKSKIIKIVGFSQDLDSKADLTHLMNRLGASNFYELLYALKAGA